jgi:putative transposase
MSRALRIEYPGCCYHVVNRGNQRLKVFASDSDYALFIEKLVIFSVTFNVEILSYCLMPNHFHLYVRTLEPNLSRFMQSFLTSFSIKMNRNKKSCGHIFQGRFKSHIVDDEAYGMVLSRYIHLNPVRTSFFSDKDADVKKNALMNFKWSSYMSYAGYSPVPDWLHTDKILEKFKAGETGEGFDKTTAYRAYVESALVGKIGNPFDSTISQIFLGSEKFVSTIRSKFTMDLNVVSHKEQSVLSRLNSSFDFAEVSKVVSDLTGVKLCDLLKRRSKFHRERRLLVYCACKYCRSRISLSEIGRVMHMSQSGVTQSERRFHKMMNSEAPLKRLLNDLEQALKSKVGV